MSENVPQTDAQAVPWYGGNKIPDSYLKRFLPSQGRLDDNGSMPTDLQYFLDEIE